MIVVTSGSEYLDIDSYAGIIGYAELLNLQGMEAIAASSVLPNHSVTADALRPDVDLKAYKPEPGDKFVLIDLSIVKFFDPIVELVNVVEIIDHHPGHEAYWQEKLGDKAQIEVIGAACTLVYERFKQAGKPEQMLPATAKVLAAGILDNTLNFTAKITTERDHTAYKDLLRLGNLNEDFAAKYFLDVQNIVEANIENAVKGDKKTVTETDLIPQHFGQIVVWDASSIVKNKKDTIARIMQTYGNDWALSLISICENRGYFIVGNLKSQQKLTDLIGVKFVDGISEPTSVILRKEMLKIALSKL